MKKINNLTSKVCLSTYDDSQTLYPVDEEYKGIENICVAVMYGDIMIKISSKDKCKCNFNEAIEKHSEDLMNPAYWQMVGSVYCEVNEAIEILGHDPINWVWTSTQYSGLRAWYYYGTFGFMLAISKLISGSVRPAQAFQI